MHVDTGANLSDSDREQLARNLNLVRELGGEVVSLTDVDIVEALIQTARQRSVTQLVIGHPAKRRLRDLFGGGSLLDRLAVHATTFDIHILKPMRDTSAAPQSGRSSTSKHPLFATGLCSGSSSPPQD